MRLNVNKIKSREKNLVLIKSKRGFMGYKELVGLQKEIALLGSIQSQLWWDREVNLPVNSHGLRDEQDKIISTLIQSHYKSTAFQKHLDQSLSDQSVGKLSSLESRQLDLIRRDFAISTCVSKEFLERYVDSQNKCYGKFKEAKKEAQFKTVEPAFTEMVKLYTESAEMLKDHALMREEYKEKEIYDVMIDSKFDPGFSNETLKKVLLPLKDFLVANRTKIQEKRPATEMIGWSRNKQMEISRKLCEVLGFDLREGRIDETPIHPFCGGSVGDVRLTTRIDENDSVESVMSTMHEAGHGLYQQGLPKEYFLEPLGGAPSAAIHESQSRFIENQIGRSAPFVKYFSKLTGESYDRCYRAIAGKKESFLRTEADEVDYNLHVVLRWEMEQDLVSGKLGVGDIPEVWNGKYKNYFGIEVPDDRWGCVQDIHWYGIGFGYFPSYSIGNIIAAQLFSKFESENKNWEERIENGNLLFVRDWLGKKVHRLGARKDTPGTISEMFEGEALSPQYLISYLSERYG